MELNEIKYGFKLVSVKEVKDFNATLYEFDHLKSGGHVAYLANDDTNCCFAIGFKTVPMDSTGVCHIIEHSTLCGSDKYPLKEPFVNLLKTSLATFLNAFTAADWTMYPFASQTPKDFDNILSIYLDAVFNPRSKKDIRPFLQEGWHLELNNEDDIPCYKGVVYNEMKGAMSSIDEQLNAAVKEVMYDESSTYHYNSGGDPDVIPELTYEQYKAFHSKHYTPQNAMTYLYGKMDVEEKLKFIDEEYFSKFEKTDDRIVINRAKDVINTTYTKEYEIGADEDVKDNTYMSLCYELDDASNYESLLAMKILTDTLLSDNDQPLKKALLDAKLGQDVSCMVDDDNIVPALYINLEKTNLNQRENFLNTFVSEVRKLTEKGIDKAALTATINSTEFSMKEMDTGRMAKGLIFAMNMMSSFNAGLELSTNLEFSKYFDKFRKEMDNGYFEKLLERLILNSKHYVLATCVPSKTLGAKKKEAMDAKMKAIKESMSKEEIKALVKQTKDLIAFQNHVDTKKELATLPALKISDLPKTINYLDTRKTKVNGYDTIYHDIYTNKIAYMRMYFNTDCIALQDQPYVSVLVSLLTNLNTKNYDISSLNNTIKTYLGNLSFSKTPITKSREEAHNYVVVNASALLNNVNYMNELINEVLLTSKFTKKETMTIIRQLAVGYKQQFIQNGMAVAMEDVRSHYSSSGALAKYTGVSRVTLKFINDLAEEKNFTNISSKLKEIAKKIFTKKNCVISISGDEETRDALKNVIKALKLPRAEAAKELVITRDAPANEALVIPSGVNYCALGNNIFDFNSSYDGKYFVLTPIVVLDYLWTEVRVKGGAYGQRFNIDRTTGDFTICSYRDPNVSNTYKVYENLPEYLRNFNVSNKEFTNYIIGSMSNFDAPLSIPSFITTWDINYLRGFTKKDKMDMKKQILATKMSDINALASLFEKVMNENASKFTIGNDSKIKEYSFDKVSNL